jgi:TrmH family RNA methyltransferase
MKSIRSAANPRLKALRKLVESSQARRRAGLSILDGTHLVAAYRDHVGPPEELLVSESAAADPEIRALLERTRQVEPLLLPDSLFGALSPVATPQGIIAVIRTPEAGALPRLNEPCVMIEALQDPGNLGSLLRTAAAAGIGRVLLSKGSVQAWSPRVLRAGMGAHFTTHVHEGVDLRVAARAFEGRVIATSGRAGRSLFETDLRGPVALLFGNEGGGISPELATTAHEVVAIPMPGKAESLNVAAAAAVCLFERVRQLAVIQ